MMSDGMAIADAATGTQRTAPAGGLTLKPTIGYCADCGTWDAHGRFCAACGCDFTPDSVSETSSFAAL